jgi:hypothetical protein
LGFTFEIFEMLQPFAVDFENQTVFLVVIVLILVLGPVVFSQIPKTFDSAGS